MATLSIRRAGISFRFNSSRPLLAGRPRLCTQKCRPAATVVLGGLMLAAAAGPLGGGAAI